jgi:hypothetical protein
VSIESVDATERPRSERDILDAIACVESEMILSTMAMSKKHGPLLMHYTVIRDALRELLLRRAKELKP